MSLLLTIRTADRSPKKNYLRATVDSLRGGGVPWSDIHIFPTDLAREWMRPYPDAVLHWPERTMRANENAIRMIGLLDEIDADWIVMSEDDLEWCPDPIESMSRWLGTYHHPDVSIYRFFAFDTLKPVGAHVGTAPLREMRGSQVVAMRAADARRFAAWAKAHPLDWRPKGAPFQDRPHDGFDKLLGYWALQDRPSMTTGLVSRPFFVKHLGVQSSLHRFGVRKDAEFIGATSWP